MRWWLAFALAACGRVAFDPLGGGGEAGVSRGDGGGSAKMDGGTQLTDGAMPDAFVPCANAFALTQGMLFTTSTCASGDHFDGCGPAATQEVILKFTATTTGTYTFRAFDSGTQNTTNTTSRLNAACQLQSGCTGILSFGVTAGQTVYFMVESSSGGCVQIDYSVM